MKQCFHQIHVLGDVIARACIKHLCNDQAIHHACQIDPEKRISVAEMLKAINDLIEQLSAPRFPLAENLSSPETFIPHSRDNELKAIRKQMDSGVRPIFLYDQKNAM